MAPIRNQISPKKVENIRRLQWRQFDFRQSIIPVSIAILLTQFLIFFSLVVVVIVFSQLTNHSQSLELLFLGVLLMIIAVDFIGSFYLLARYKATWYRLVPGSIRKLNDEIIDVIPGKLVASRGLLKRRTIIFTIDEFDRIRYVRTLFGRVFNYGTVILEDVNKLKDTQTFMINNIRHPEIIVGYIQQMIDMSREDPQILMARRSPR